MRVQVKFFAIFREMIGVKAESKEIAEGTTIEQLWKEYTSDKPRAEKMRSAYAVNQKLVKPDHVLHDGDEVGFLPPVSGGQVNRNKLKVKSKNVKRKTKRANKISGDSRDSRKNKDAFITRKTIDLNALYGSVAFPGAGAILLFSGVVRDNSKGKSVKHLEYEAYPQMAEQSMRDIIAEVHERWADVRMAMAHRIGKIKIGESSLIIAVSAPHRGEAYAASRYAIERVKAILPVWKKEFATDGAEWVEGPIAGEVTSEKADAIVREAEERAQQKAG
ncbi:MAG: molybdenum cofactor biosynthesis protein MoaE [Chloroflexi bacterium]|nr:molybdenum cofactor biosynthesis protein MoaE [Chloroflexota bacterium]